MSQVVLVNNNDEPIGSMDKMQAHTEGLLHRAFSVFIFNSRGQMLLQQRVNEKYHSGGLWTNACCSHPQPGETSIDAARRRLLEEMGFTTTIIPAFTFTYKTTFENGLTEHEFDHVYTGIYEDSISPNPVEVLAYKYVDINLLKEELSANPEQFTYWFKIAFPKLEDYLIANPLSFSWK